MTENSKAKKFGSTGETVRIPRHRATIAPRVASPPQASVAPVHHLAERRVVQFRSTGEISTPRRRKAS